MRVLCSVGFFVGLLHLSSSLLLGAFNIKTFGDTKASNTTLMDVISTVVHRYDVILIQEVRDNDLSATKKLMEHVNKGSSQFSYIVSEPLGRSTYTERYLFLYSLKRWGPFDPISVLHALPSFTLIPQHTSPDLAVAETDALYDVVTDVRTRWNTNNIVLLGDFNAGCTYVSGSDWEQIRLFTDKSFHWLIPNTADTTVSHTNCPYDRIVVTADMLKGVVHSSAQVYDFMADLRLSQDLALAVSDHFPVEVKLTTSLFSA